MSEKVFKYKMIEWSKVTPFYMGTESYKPDKIVELTEKEAYTLNRALTLNRTGKRYIKLDDNDTKR